MHDECLCELIPHAGAMCLIDELVGWDADHLRCRTRSHRSATNPLRGEAGLAMVQAVEYAGQATALHAGLLARSGSRAAAPAVLAALSKVSLQPGRLSDLDAALEIRVDRLYGAGSGAIYAFDIRCGGQPVASGRLSVMAGAEGEP